MVTLPVNLADCSYSVVIGEGVLSELGPRAADLQVFGGRERVGGRAFVVADAGLPPAIVDVARASLEAAKTRSTSRWVDGKLGDVPVCFLTNGDTTGGNSGSPVVNGKGELIGLNFDRVFENVVGDFAWNKDRSRNVVCDVRYILWVVESVLPSKHLLTELGS